VTTSKKIGLDFTSGIQGDLRTVIHIVEEDLTTEIQRINQHVEDKRSSNQLISILVTIGLSALVFIAVMVVAKQIIVPLQNFSRRITDIRIANDLSQRAEETDDEIGAISKEFKVFMAHFQNLIKSINKTVEALETSTSIVSNSVAKTTKGLLNQTIESNMVVTAVTEMSMAANEIALNAHNTKDKRQKTKPIKRQ
jgi:methyl-accepting chemotaxis protein